MEEKTCKGCNETYPLTEEFFYRHNRNDGFYNFSAKCKICKKEQMAYNYRLQKAKKEKALEDAWKEEFKNKIFVCKHCGQEKTFGEMRVNSTKKKMESNCKTCFNKKNKEYKQNYEAKVFERVLEERRNKQKGEIKK